MKISKNKNEVIGMVEEKMNKYYVVDKSGEEYELFAIRPMEQFHQILILANLLNLLGNK